MVQPNFYPGNSASVQSELSQEVIDLQKILDFTSSEVSLMDQQFNGFKQPTGRGRNSSISSTGQPTGSPESGISGCELSPHFADPLSPPEYADPVQVSMQEANIFSNTTAMDGLTNLLQLQEELMTNTEVDSLTSQSSPLYKDTNPLLGQTRSTQFTSAAATAQSFLAPPLLRTPQYGFPHMPSAAAHTAVSPTSSATSVIVRANSNQANFSLPGSISLHANHVVDGPKVGNKEKSSLPMTVMELETRGEEETGEPVVPKQEPGPDGKYLCYVCGEKAGKHSYYGGQVCASCRAFFR